MKKTEIITISILYEELKKITERLDNIKSTKPIPEFISVNQAAKILKVDYYWILKRILAGDLRAAKIIGKKKNSYRIDTEDFKRYCQHLKSISKVEEKQKPLAGREFAYQVIGKGK